MDRREFLLLGGGGGTPTLDLDFRNGNLLWGGSTTLETAITCVRADDGFSTAPNSPDGIGTWETFTANKPRVTSAGLWGENFCRNECLWNEDATQSAWTLSNMTVANRVPTPSQTKLTSTQVAVITSGTTWTVPADFDAKSNIVMCFGSGGNGAGGTDNTNGGGGGGGGAHAATPNIALVPGSTVAVQIGVAGGTNATFLKDNSGTTRVSADYGRSASGATGGAQGTAAASIGTVRTNGTPGRNGSSGTGKQGGGAGGGCAGPVGTPGASTAGSTAGGGGSGGANGGGAAGAAGGSAGGAGGTSQGGSAGGAGGTAAAAATSGTNGAGAGGGFESVGINGANGSFQTLSFIDAVTGNPVSAGTGPGSGGGGGGRTGGNGGNGTHGGGGGGGGSNTGAQGTAGTGSDGFIIVAWGMGANQLTATADDATISQSFTLASAAYLPQLLLYQAAAGDITGAIELAEADGTTFHDVSSQLVVGNWVPVSVPAATLANPVFKMRIAKSGDKIGFRWAMMTTSDTPTTFIPTRSAFQRRQADDLTLNLSNFPAFVTALRMTVYCTYYAKRPGFSFTMCCIQDGADTNVVELNANTTHNGVTYTPDGTGVDPLRELTAYNTWRAVAFSYDTTCLQATTSLRGNSSSSVLSSMPDPSAIDRVKLLAQGPTGGAPLFGCMGQFMIYANQAHSADRLNSWTMFNSQ